MSLYPRAPPPLGVLAVSGRVGYRPGGVPGVLPGMARCKSHNERWYSLLASDPCSNLLHPEEPFCIPLAALLGLDVIDYVMCCVQGPGFGQYLAEEFLILACCVEE